jgi:hypothetical protein
VEQNIICHLDCHFCVVPSIWYCVFRWCLLSRFALFSLMFRPYYTRATSLMCFWGVGWGCWLLFSLWLIFYPSKSLSDFYFRHIASSNLSHCLSEYIVCTISAKHLLVILKYNIKNTSLVIKCKKKTKKHTKHHTVETVSKSNRNMYKLAKLISLTDKYVTTLIPGWYRHFNKKWRSYISIYYILPTNKYSQ